MKLVELGKNAKIISGYAFKSESFTDNGTPVIKISNIGLGDMRIEESNTQYVENEYLDKLDEKFKVSFGDILISLTGSHITQPNSVVGRVALYKEPFISLLNQRAGKVISIDKTVFNKRFLFYILSSDSVRTTIALMAYGAASQANVSPKDVERIKLLVPIVEQQQKIAAILSAYDDLIENNKKRIQILENMAEELYKEWFVRFRFPNWDNTEFGKGIPKDWKFVNLLELVDITYGYAFDSTRFNTEGIGKKIIRIRNIPISRSLDYTDELPHDKYLIQTGDLLVGMDGDFHMNRWFDEESYLVQRSCRIKSKLNIYSAFIRQAIKAPIHYFQSTILGATVGHLGAKHLNSIEILVPNLGCESLFLELNRLDELSLNLELQNRKLEVMRDNLLPRLISGKLSVEDLDIQFPPSI